jgi:hypothetical protein
MIFQYGKDQDDVVFASVHLDKVREVSKSTGITKTPTYLVGPAPLPLPLANVEEPQIA